MSFQRILPTFASATLNMSRGKDLLRVVSVREWKQCNGNASCTCAEPVSPRPTWSDPPSCGLFPHSEASVTTRQVNDVYELGRLPLLKTALDRLRAGNHTTLSTIVRAPHLGISDGPPLGPPWVHAGWKWPHPTSIDWADTSHSRIAEWRLCSP